MRNRLRDLIAKTRPDHAGLAYEVWAPVGEDGKVPDSERQGWLQRVASTSIPDGYQTAFERWKRSLARPDTRIAYVCTKSRLLVGHGNPAPNDVGLTLHRTWGVPVMPGSAIKGVVAAYVHAVYGTDAPEDEPDRQPFAGVRWDGRRIKGGPGEAYRRLFGAPDADDGSTASRGEVVFHDALWVPEGEDKMPLAPDILTVHHRGYYAGKNEPNDYDAPNPVAFLTVKPETRFLLAWSGPEDALGFAEPLVEKALTEWGIGGKTAAGYGRLVVEHPRGAKLDALETWIARAQAEQMRPLDRLDAVERDWIEDLVTLSEHDRGEARRLLRTFIVDDKRTKERRKRILARLAGNG